MRNHTLDLIMSFGIITSKILTVSLNEAVSNRCLSDIRLVQILALDSAYVRNVYLHHSQLQRS